MTRGDHESTDERVLDLDESWSVAGATLYRAADDPADPERFGGTMGASALAAALDRATETVRESPPDADGYAVPLHEADSAAVTDEYVLWRPDTEQFGWYDTAFGIDGTVRFVDVGDAARTTIGDRLRRWHPDETPDDDRTEDADGPTTDDANGDGPTSDGASADGPSGNDHAATDAADDSSDDVDVPPAVVEPNESSNVTSVEGRIDAVRETVAAERDAARRANRARHRNATLDALVDDGIAVGPFVSLGRANHESHIGEFTLQRATGAPGDGDEYRDETTLHRDSVLLVDARDDAPEFPLAVRTTRVDDPTVRVKPARAGDVPLERFETLLTDRDRDFHLTPLLNPVPFERRTDALDALAADDQKRALFAGTRPVTFTADERTTPSVPLDLDAYQRRALKWADDAEDVLCIHGPPGTGKTRTLTAYVCHAAARGESVLVTAHSNQAVDNLLVGDSTRGAPDPGSLHAFAAGASQTDRERDHALDLDVARVGRGTTNPVVRDHYANAAVANADVVATTTNGAARFDANAFDVGVVDEATQASRAATAIVLAASETLVLAGDHKQLPPYAATDTATDRAANAHNATNPHHGQHAAGDATRPSLFEDLLDAYGDDVSVLLRRQYRMHDAIAAFPNDAFYDGRLETAARNADWRVRDRDPLVAVDVHGPERQEHGGDSYHNPTEVDVVADEVTALLDGALDPADVGVISTYAAQADRIRSRLADGDVPGGQRVTVDTVDSFQGGEREAIVVSLVRSNDTGASGFLETPTVGPRRLNVALTRARRRLVLVGDFDTLGTVAPHRDPDDSCADLYRDLAAAVREHGRMETRR
ncbi:AAA domain-containing protein [Halorubellus sp. PRR65]|uniref:AAA domain-containing protein n=1 Tax=Halorubellus sp. PRR65 TaxID=3098148 RepID=UPI002B257C0C|nr:AAA domain-containing protein [Halorubellus sp. PRR65]